MKKSFKQLLKETKKQTILLVVGLFFLIFMVSSVSAEQVYYNDFENNVTGWVNYTATIVMSNAQSWSPSNSGLISGSQRQEVMYNAYKSNINTSVSDSYINISTMYRSGGLDCGQIGLYKNTTGSSHVEGILWTSDCFGVNGGRLDVTRGGAEISFAGNTSCSALTDGTWYNVSIYINNVNSTFRAIGFNVKNNTGSSVCQYQRFDNDVATSGTDWTIGLSSGTGGVNTFYVDNLGLYDSNLSPSVSNFSISVVDVFDSSSISNFSANVSGTIYSTTSGTITTNLLSNYTSLVDITIFNANNNYGAYFNKTYSNYNVSSNLQANVSQTEIRFNGVEKITNNTLTGMFWSSGVSKFSNQAFNFKATSYNVTFVNATYSSVYNKTQSYTFTPLQNTTLNLTNIYNNVLNVSVKKVIDNSTITSFIGNISNSTYNYFEGFTTTTGFKELQLIKNINYSLFIEAENYTNYNNTGFAYVYPTTNNLTQTFYLYALNTINFLFFDQATNTQITWKTITLDLISDIFSNSYTTTTGNMSLELLDPESYTARYYASDYTTRFYYFTLQNNTYQTTTLYLINESNYANITINVLDQGTQGVENAYVKALKYDLNTNSYILQEIGRTNIEGTTILTLTKFDEYYKFIIEYDDQILLTSNPSYITSDSLTFQIVIGENIGEQYYTKAGINYQTSFNANTNNFRLEFSNIDSLASNVCFYTYLLSATGKTLTNSTCSTSASATLLLGVSPTNGSIYQAESYYLYSDGNYYLLDSMTYQYGVVDYFGKSGVILQILLTLTFALAVSWKPSYALITIPSSLLLGRIIGLTILSYEVIVPLIIVGIVIALVVRD